MLQRLSKRLQPFAASKLGPVGGASQSARVDEVVAPPAAGGSGGDGGDGGSGWAWSLLAIVPAAHRVLVLQAAARRPPAELA